MAKFIIPVILVLFLTAPTAGAETKVLVIKSDGMLPYEDIISGFQTGLQERDVQLFIMGGNEDRSAIATRIKEMRPEIVLCVGTRALENTLFLVAIPKIFCLVTAVKASSLADREDIYGVTIDVPPAAQFRSIRQALPDVRRIGVLYNPAQNQKVIDEAAKSARMLDFRLVPAHVRSITEIPSALRELEGKIDLLWSLYDQTVYSPETTKYILLHCLRNNIPFVGFSPQFAKAGALMAFYPDYRSVGYQSGVLAAGILSGQDVPKRIVNPQRMRIAINKKVARCMALSFPPTFLKTVDQVY